MDMLAVILGNVAIIRAFNARAASVQRTVEALLLIDPELKTTLFPLVITAERHLWYLFLQLIQDLAIGDIAHLMVLFHYQAILVADCVVGLTNRHQRSTCLVRLTDIAIYAFPPVFTLALLALPRRAICSISQRAAEDFATVLATEARRTIAFAAAFCTVRILIAAEVISVTVEAWWTFWRAVILQ